MLDGRALAIAGAALYARSRAWPAQAAWCCSSSPLARFRIVKAHQLAAAAPPWRRRLDTVDGRDLSIAGIALGALRARLASSGSVMLQQLATGEDLVC